jgi:hypothetical protein
MAMPAMPETGGKADRSTDRERDNPSDGSKAHGQPLSADPTCFIPDTALLDWQTMHLQERELVPVAALKGDASVTHSEKTTAAETQWIAPLERDDNASFVDRLHNARHLGGRKIPLEHGADRVATLDWRLRHLMIDGVRMVKIRQPRGVSGVEPLDPAFDYFAR